MTRRLSAIKKLKKSVSSISIPDDLVHILHEIYKRHGLIESKTWNVSEILKVIDTLPYEDKIQVYRYLDDVVKRTVDSSLNNDKATQTEPVNESPVTKKSIQMCESSMQDENAAPEETKQDDNVISSQMISEPTDDTRLESNAPEQIIVDEMSKVQTTQVEQCTEMNLSEESRALSDELVESKSRVFICKS